jgi:signal transduction histidine kinase
MTGISQETSTDSIRYYNDITYKSKKEEDLFSALAYYLKRNGQAISTKDTLGIVYNLRNIAIAQKNLGLYSKSESTAVDALKYIHAYAKDSLMIEPKSGVYNHLGRVYRALHNAKESLRYYNKALVYATTLRDSLRIINNTASINRDQGNYLLAIEKLNTVFQKIKKKKDRYKVQDNLGFNQAKLKNPEGFKNMSQALEGRIAIKDSAGIYTSYNHFSKYYIDRNQEALALQYSNRAYSIAKHLNNKEYIYNALSELAAFSESPRTLLYLKMTDSIRTAQMRKENAYAALEYDYTAAQQRTQAAELAREKEKKKKQTYIFLGLFVLLSAIFTIVLLQSKHKKNNLVQIYKTETRISKKVHDEVANDLYFVMTKLQHKDTLQEEVLDDLEDIYLKTRDISRENSDINTKDNFAETLQFLLLNYKTEKTEIITKGIKAIDWNVISEHKKTAFYRVMQELMTNMKKHSKATLVVVTASQLGKKLEIQYTDNGIGGAIQKGNGLHNTENRIQSVNGTIIFDASNKQGFTAKISL